MKRSARVFFAKGKPTIVVAMHVNAAGLYYEQEKPIVLAAREDRVALGAAVRECVQRFTLKDMNLRPRKAKDWPAFRASKCRSVREFEYQYSGMEIEKFNDSEHIALYDAWMLPFRESEIRFHSTLNLLAINDEETGRRLISLFEACQRWAEIQ
jgi:hypothetical protein